MGEGHRQSTILYESVYVCRSSGYPNHEDVKEQRPIIGAEFDKKIESQKWVRDGSDSALPSAGPSSPNP